jgi:hypothetical protein
MAGGDIWRAVEHNPCEGGNLFIVVRGSAGVALGKREFEVVADGPIGDQGFD